jgi:hypothetical protein
MKEIIRGQFFALYSQIALVDFESSDVYPEWVTGDEPAVMNSKGVAVSALGDSMIEVIVYEGEEKIDGIEVISGVIHVETKGLLVGNEVAGNSVIFPWPAGRTMLRVFAKTLIEAARITFILQPLK